MHDKIPFPLDGSKLAEQAFPYVAKLAKAVIVKMNEREAELVLANLKARMEA